ncbi:MAG TPA: hypothetical protein VML54_08945 [Candidatus Limnocylindrales bacterium]|nr:hypothetical protein [Candidatus Limnocylindrales bacterium]
MPPMTSTEADTRLIVVGDDGSPMSNEGWQWLTAHPADVIAGGSEPSHAALEAFAAWPRAADDEVTVLSVSGRADAEASAGTRSRARGRPADADI